MANNFLLVAGMGLKLCEKLKSYGVKGLAFKWFADYLFQRSQVVKLGQELSAPCSLVCGVPQGSILGG